MPSAEYTTTAKLPLDTIWEFVKEMDNWAELVTGYQSHVKESETDSLWVLKGDVGVMARTLKFRVHITEWNGPSRVAFELEGLNEPMDGSGCFEMAPHEAEDAGAAGPARRSGFFVRMLEAIARFFLRGFGGGRPPRAKSADAGPGRGVARLTLRLELRPGGPMAPMVNAMIKPVMLPAAEQLTDGIMARLEQLHGRA